MSKQGVARRTLLAGAFMVGALSGCGNESLTAPAEEALFAPAPAMAVMSAKATNAQPAYAIEDLGGAPDVVIAAASLLRSQNGVKVTMDATVAAPNTATVWAVVFNAPEYCASAPCGMSDLTSNPAARGGMANLGGRVLGGDRAVLNRTLREGDTSGLTRGYPLEDASGAEVHFILRVHGPQLPGEVDDQIHTLTGGCGQNTCVNAAAAIFLAPGA